MRLENEDVLLHWPLAQHIITAGWLYNDGSLHRALDFRAAVGTPVYAAADGTVETAYRWNGRRTQGDTNSYGNMLKLRHADYRGGRLETLYAHLSKLCVAQGETVYEGQLIGLMRQVTADFPDATLFSLPSVGGEGGRRHIELGMKGPAARVEQAMALITAEMSQRGYAWEPARGL